MHQISKSRAEGELNRELGWITWTKQLSSRNKGFLFNPSQLSNNHTSMLTTLVVPLGQDSEENQQKKIDGGRGIPLQHPRNNLYNNKPEQMSID